jgi:hypothetical protein
MTGREADRRLDLIRALMERATQWPGLRASACLGAAACALAGSAACFWRGLDFRSDETLWLWLSVAAVSFLQFVGYTVAGARRRGEPAFSRLTWAALGSMLPGLFAGAVLTFAVPPELRPGVWMLCYGAAVYSLGYFAGVRVKIVGVLFLAAGALTAVRPELGLLMMAVAFGGLHALLGLLLLLQPKENYAAVLFDEIEDR